MLSVLSSKPNFDFRWMEIRDRDGPVDPASLKQCDKALSLETWTARSVAPPKSTKFRVCSILGL